MDDSQSRVGGCEQLDVTHKHDFNTSLDSVGQSDVRSQTLGFHSRRCNTTVAVVQETSLPQRSHRTPHAREGTGASSAAIDGREKTTGVNLLLRIGKL